MLLLCLNVFRGGTTVYIHGTRFRKDQRAQLYVNMTYSENNTAPNITSFISDVREYTHETALIWVNNIKKCREFACIHFSTHLCHHPHSRHPSLLHSLTPAEYNSIIWSPSLVRDIERRFKDDLRRDCEVWKVYHTTDDFFSWVCQAWNCGACT